MKSTKINLYRKLGFIVSLVLLLSFMVSACGSNTPQPYWRTDATGYFYTNELDKAQAELPFKIAQPSYLPKDINLPQLQLEGSQKSITHELKSDVTLRYYPAGTQKETITLYENNYSVPGPDPQARLNINGTTVVETRFYDTMIGPPYGVLSLIFEWTKDGVYYNLKSYQYVQDEALKIVESMIPVS
jgi:Domain of unknown function (DUF4367)